jgi:hypothetical protein
VNINIFVRKLSIVHFLKMLKKAGPW